MVWSDKKMGTREKVVVVHTAPFVVAGAVGLAHKVAKEAPSVWNMRLIKSGELGRGQAARAVREIHFRLDPKADETQARLEIQALLESLAVQLDEDNYALHESLDISVCAWR